jgi:hypothetical protein
VYIKTISRERDSMGNVVGIGRSEVVDPRAETANGFGAFVQRDSPFVHKLGIKAVHEECLAGWLNSGSFSSSFETILHAENEPFYPWQETRYPMTDVKEIMVDLVSEPSVII